MLKARLEKSLQRTWYGGHEPGRLLRWLERFYTTVAQNRARSGAEKQAMDLKSRPIVVVGNITVGGTGKTPLVLRLCELLKDAGLHPAVVSRGYGRTGKSLVLLDGRQPVSVTGDEPRLIYDRTGVPVAVGPDRNASTRHLFRAGADVVISDDGLQRADFPRSYEICVIDGQRGLGNGHLLPAGPLRESADRLSSVDSVVITRPTADFELGADPVGMTLEPMDPHRLDDSRSLPLEAWKSHVHDRNVLAIAGIGHPQKFFSMLERLGIVHQPRAFPDHHTYTAGDFSGVEDALIIMTEKDAVKCRSFGLQNAWYLPVSARLPEAWEQDFVDRVRALVHGGSTSA